MGQPLDARGDDRLHRPRSLALDTTRRKGEWVARRWTDLDEGSRTLLRQTRGPRLVGQVGPPI